ncbi:MAG: glycosyltransferase family 1 protein [Propioniciclava sp.]|uniref:glycosyltransferase family 4 protein n=1 Tax=Propioniciclava sp. TaxID=2038686 RepID=UPI0039E213C0
MHQVREVAFPERIIDRHVGGNTTYARYLAQGLRDRGVTVSRIRSGRNAPLTALQETLQGMRRPVAGKVLHYSADTGPLLPTRGPSVVTVHGVASRWISTARNPRQEKIWRTRVARAIASTNAIITVSQSSADDVSAVFDVPQERITTIHHGIDLAHFVARREPTAVMESLAGRPYVLYLGNIEPRKNLIELVEAFKHPSVVQLGVRLVIAGKPAWNAQESMAAIESGPVDYLGFVSDDDRVALMQHARLFAFPSLYEGFGFPVLEAMAAGTPVLTSNRGSLAEVAGPAMVIEDVSRDGIAEGLIRALQQETPSEQTIAEGKAWASRFTWDASLEQHLAVYNSVTAA